MKKKRCKNCKGSFRPKRARDEYCDPQCGREGKTGQRQVASIVWSFRCGHTAVLPERVGWSNDEALWKSNQAASTGGCWICRRCVNREQKHYRQGTGRLGLITRLRKLLRQARVNSELRGYKPITLSADEVLEIWEKQRGLCAACGDPVSFSRRVQMDHDHQTGRVRGFICMGCNLAEGFLKTYTPERFKRFCAYVRRCQKENS